MAAAGGFTMPELIVVIMVSMILIGGSVTVMTANMKNEPRIAERTADVQGARVAMESLTRELRQGATVVSASGTQLSVITNVNSASCGGAASTEVRSCRVTYSCTSGTCTRRESNPDGSLPSPPQTVVQGIAAGSVFTYSPNSSTPAYVGVKLTFPAADGDDSISLSDGVTMRSVTVPSS
ncbi:MAG TPA: hypothetical protein VD766_03250 [Solirubrobacterales bacterium]|nr:hypothetical protein [Solirubrobacterales bacterium]